MSASPAQTDAAISPPMAAASAALAHLAAARPRDALASLDELAPIALDAGQANLVGRIYLLAGDAAKALRCFESALETDPSFLEAIGNKARALAAGGEIDAALSAFATAFARGWSDPVAYYDHANLLRGQARLPEAIESYDKALSLRQAYPEALRAAGTVLRDLGNKEAALRFFDEALRLAPNYTDAALDQGNLHLEDGRLEEALAAYVGGLSHHPRNALLMTNRGIVLHELGRLEEALDALEGAIDADPDLPAAHLNHGNVLCRMGSYAAALVSVDKAIALSPFYPKAHATRGLLLKMHGAFEAAEQALETALAQQPGFPHALTNLGALRLLQGDLERGWPDYEYRLLTDGLTRPRIAPDWDGHVVRGHRLAVFADHGAGDYINFVRYIPVLAKSELDVTFVCQPKMQRLFRAATSGVRVTQATTDDERFDSQLMLSSAPRVMKTTLATIPGATSYLAPEPALVRSWASRIGQQGFKIGLCWRGNQDWRGDPNRSVPLDLFAALARLPGVRLLSLQRPDNTGIGDDALVRLGIEPLGHELDNGPDAFVDTAAAMAHLDLVVTCDTSIAHLGGALGRPTFVLLQMVPEWRWMMEGETSPWYDSVRLFRQERAGEWNVPIDRVCRAVEFMRDAR